jgi:aspartyl-tRNA(Asn)/glutamyl-tRNA(Gln) amidotransferase subunit A
VREAAALLGTPEVVDLGDVRAVWDANTVILYCDAAAYHEERLKSHPDWFGISLKDRLPVGLTYRGIDDARARNVQREWISFLTQILGDTSILAAPTTPEPATVIGDREGSTLGRRMSCLTSPFNLAGAPAISIPVGMVDRLPVGMQLVAAPGRESLLREAGRELEARLASAASGQTQLRTAP